MTSNYTVTVAEAAEQIGVSIGTIRRLIKAGLMKAKATKRNMRGISYMIQPEEVERIKPLYSVEAEEIIK